METSIISLLAAVGGFSVTLAMSGKVAFETLHSRFASHDDADLLRLFVNGKDYSVNLKTISNGGSATIRKALNELENCH